MARPRLGWLGPAIVLLGAAIAGVGIWYFLHARPAPGAVIDTIAIDASHSLVVRGEAGGERAFVELREGDRLIWQALVPRYAGRPGAPGIAWSPTAVSVRVIRDGRAEVFALAMRDATKLGGMRLAAEHGPVVQPPTGPVTLTDHLRSYEIVSGPGWNQLVALDLRNGRALWSRELGPDQVRAGGVDEGPDRRVWIDQGAGPRRFDAVTGTPDLASRPGSSNNP